MLHCWRWFMQRMGRRGQRGPVAAVDMQEVMRQYLSALPCPPCPYLAPQHVLRLVPAQPRSAAAIWREAVRTGMMPQKISSESFRSALMQLSPLLLSVKRSVLDEGEEDMLVSWQPWVPLESRSCNGAERHAEEGPADGGANSHLMKLELRDVVPSYFVASALVRDQLQLRLNRGVGGELLRWQQLTHPPLASLLEWSEDYRVVRLSALASGCSRADDLYSLKSQPELLHDALNALVLLLPTFIVPERRVQAVYRSHFVEVRGVFHSKFGPRFLSRFPDASALTDHPDVQFALQRETADGMRLHPDFLHANRGAPNFLYVSFPSAGDVVTEIDARSRHQRHVRQFLHAPLPYCASGKAAAMLRQMSQEKLLGLHFVLEADQDQWKLAVATIPGDVITFTGAVSSLHRLSVAGVSAGGLPTEVVHALTSPQFIKILLIDSPHMGEWGSEGGRRVMSFLRHHLKVEAQLVCSLWKWALFVGLPVRPPSTVSVAYCRHLLARLGVAVAPSTPTALLAALCASRLLTLHESEGYRLDMDVLRQLLTADDAEAWQMRNLELRIKRYGLVPREAAAQSQSRQILLQHLSSLYGPEVCILDLHSTPAFSTAAAGEDAPEERQPIEAKPSKREVEVGVGEDIVEASGAVSDAQRVGQQNTEEEWEAKAVLPDPDTEAVKKEEVDDEEVFSAMFAADDAGVVPATPAATTPAAAPRLAKESPLHNDVTAVPVRDESRFLLSPPDAAPGREKHFRSDRRGPRPLPPPFTISHSTGSARRGSVAAPHTPSSATSASPVEVSHSRHVEEVETEGELISRLTREISCESQLSPRKGSGREAHAANAVLLKKTRDLMEELLRNTMKK
ncbi:uncharacterized protein Tco025E_04685 [Trypanosoma conorhini]|uniref:Uncharacterized protein n=1 Tax=Trypanosoma conorhini TaxID=83891 RepID=A0A3R7L1M6_9TRYP|nr:uncharacterized protein Tco025E_04685 [Trypanosoma conorhini]RNF17849.1 hypothetical protein Tco025E_04685 [Trypanosoma conorhini]